ncbi:hypothetical protein LV716_13130 [Flagellimonas sp. HMM57]|uniref:hypothetical protein n=1 Tax=unclassified Flagellimonas TaxID=2644544 RepID=UPI0013D1EDD5|nr:MULTISPECIES: hypothetical protein [unclassified Flagellimonas]UII75196.1 hypothetical protein LV716_13130 [Flagellimonas sp. HMM57]
MKKIALIEFNTYHDECIYSQIKFLKESEYLITLIVSPQILERANEYLHLVEKSVVYDGKSTKNILEKINKIFKLSKYLSKNKVETVVFNTASSRLEVIVLSNLLKGKANLFGILHNLKKVNHSLSQKLINRAIKKFFVLNDFLLDSNDLKNQSIELSSFYPIFFPEYSTSNISKPKKEIWISIPGKLDFNRRDYDILTDALLQIKPVENIKILILGRTNGSEEKNKQFLDNIKSNGVRDNFVLFDSFIEDALFHEYISKSDYVLLPLKHVGENYSKYKIMGSYNLAFAYRKNLISPKGLSHIEDFNLHAVFYNDVEELAKVLKNICKNSEKYKQPYDGEKWNFEAQKNKYINFLEK